MRKISTKTGTTMGIGDSLNPLLILNQVLGLTVIEIPYGRPWSKLSFTWTLIRIAIYSSVFWYADQHFPFNYNTTPVIYAVFRIIIFANVAIAAVAKILALINYQKRKELLMRLKLIDETLEFFGIEPDYESGYKENLRLVLLWCCGLCIIFTSDLIITTYVFNGIMETLARLFVYETPLILNATVELNFAVYIATLGKRFERVNALIQSVATPPLTITNLKKLTKYENILKHNQSRIAVQPNYNFKNRNNVQFLIRVTRQLHLDLCVCGRELNDICSKQLSMQMGASFVLLTGFSYGMYIIYNESVMPLAQKVRHFILFGTWTLFSIIKMMFVVSTSVNVTTEAQKTSQLAHEIQIPRFQNKLIDEIHQFSLQIMQHPLSFTASGLVVLDFNYIRGFVGSVTTYLMILIQNQPDVLTNTETGTTMAPENIRTNLTNSYYTS